VVDAARLSADTKHRPDLGCVERFAQRASPTMPLAPKTMNLGGAASLSIIGV
jgi:hypothetical protein